MLRPRHRKDGEAWPPPELPRAQGRARAGRQGTGQGLLLLGRRAAAGSAPQALEKRAGGGVCTCGPVASAQGPALQLSTLVHVMSGFTKRFPEAQERRGPSRSKYFRRSQAHLARKLKAARDSGCRETGFQGWRPADQETLPVEKDFTSHSSQEEEPWGKRRGSQEAEERGGDTARAFPVVSVGRAEPGRETSLGDVGPQPTATRLAALSMAA